VFTRKNALMKIKQINYNHLLGMKSDKEILHFVSNKSSQSV